MVYLVFYTHRHGHNHYLFTNVADAYKCAEKIAEVNLKKFTTEEYTPSVALENWAEITQGDENIEINSFEVYKSYEVYEKLWMVV